MKIDIHVHTKKCKKGDAATRTVTPERFRAAILATEVRVVAITNHNVFDHGQFQEIIKVMSGAAQVWPGIELDVVDNGNRGHLLVIVAGKHAKKFSDTVTRLTKSSNPDDFTISIEDVVSEFDALEPVYVAHHHKKQPGISDETLQKLESRTRFKNRIIKEVTNALSAGIYISHGNRSIYGSDIHDWAKYETEGDKLPTLRLPIDDFEHFCLLLDKDHATINTVLNRKVAETLILLPFGDGKSMPVTVYNDINVFFGSKGTGKTKILEAIARHYSESGMDASVFSAGEAALGSEYDLKQRDRPIDLKHHGIDYCTDEIRELRESTDVDVVNLAAYIDHFRGKQSNIIARQLSVREFSLENETAPKGVFHDHRAATSAVLDFKVFSEKNDALREMAGQVEHKQLVDLLERIAKKMTSGTWLRYSLWRQASLLNSSIKAIKREISRKTGFQEKPSSTGFRDYALNRIQIYVWAMKIMSNAKIEIPMLKKRIGSLGPSKGDLEFVTEMKLQNGSITDGTFASLKGPSKNISKTAQKDFMKCVIDIIRHSFSDLLFTDIANLNEIENGEDIKTINELLLVRRSYHLNGKEYTPSSGEASMVMLQNELAKDKDIYILDEPERSLGNDYINEAIVPIIREKARCNKRVFISTHDANIAVRTLPYSSIYRRNSPDGYVTYVGNPFSNQMINVDNGQDKIDWKEISMKTLEGGEDAFGERGKIYGRD